MKETEGRFSIMVKLMTKFYQNHEIKKNLFDKDYWQNNLHYIQKVEELKEEYKIPSIKLSKDKAQ
jgi:hypothetical protein